MPLNEVTKQETVHLIFYCIKKLQELDAQIN